MVILVGRRSSVVVGIGDGGKSVSACTSNSIPAVVTCIGMQAGSACLLTRMCSPPELFCMFAQPSSCAFLVLPNPDTDF